MTKRILLQMTGIFNKETSTLMSFSMSLCGHNVREKPKVPCADFLSPQHQHEP